MATRPSRSRVWAAGERTCDELNTRDAVTTVADPSNDCRKRLNPWKVSSVPETGVTMMSAVASYCFGVVAISAALAAVAMTTSSTIKRQCALIAWR